MSGYRRAAQRLEGRGTSAGKMDAPTGVRTGSRRVPPIQAATRSMLSAYRRADDAALRVNQYRVTWSRIWSGARPVVRSLQASSFSPIQAHSPTGESTRAYPTVCGAVRCISEYAEDDR